MSSHVVGSSLGGLVEIELDVSFSPLSGESMGVVGQSCSNLKTMKLSHVSNILPWNEGYDDALARALTMHGLRNLQLFGNSVSS